MSGLHVSISIPRLPTRIDLVSLPWRVPLLSPGPVNIEAGNNLYPLNSFRVAPSPSADTDVHASTDSTDNSSSYMTRDTIANAAAKVFMIDNGKEYWFRNYYRSRWYYFDFCPCSCGFSGYESFFKGEGEWFFSS